MNFAFQEMFPNAMRGAQRTSFEEQYHCFSMAVSGRPHLEVILYYLSFIIYIFILYIINTNCIIL